MEKIHFNCGQDGEEVDFFVLEQTKLGGASYLLVTDSKEDDAQCWILKETGANSTESVYEFVEDDMELQAVSKMFEELLKDVEIDLSEP